MIRSPAAIEEHLMLTVEQALEIILSNVPRPNEGQFPLAAAVGKVLREDCASDLDMPPFDKAMMDGYALRSEDAGPLKVIEEIPAGKVPKSKVRPGTCSKIMTGAPLPAGADAVQQVEKTSREGAWLGRGSAPLRARRRGGRLRERR